MSGSAPPIDLLFLCTGNICRSPFAEGWARLRLGSSLSSQRRVASAGLHAVEGGRVPRFGQEVAAGLGVDLSEHRGQSMTRTLLRGRPRLVVMAPHHADDLEEHYDVSTTLLLASYAPGPIRPAEVPDPYRGPRWAFETCYRLIAEAVDQLLLAEGFIIDIEAAPGEAPRRRT